MNSEILGVLVTLVLMIVLSYPLGKYISKVLKGEKVWTDFLYPVENFIYKISGIDPNKEMDWKENMKALLKLNVFFFIWAFVIFLIQDKIPFWNPAGIGPMEPTLAFNTAVSFISNTNIQHYSGETGLSYFSQLLVVCYMQFVSAATGIAALALIFKGLSQKKATNLGNFYSLWLKSNTRILLPLAIVVAVILLFNGTPATFKGPQIIKTVQGDTVTV
ncbi:MAG: potassium-transporting ATPase subunit KdpA, partial [Ignavibacteriaceae bacterium]